MKFYLKTAVIATEMYHHSMRGLLHALYWRLHAAYLRNQREESLRFLGFIDSEIKGNNSLLGNEIGVKHLTRFMMIKDRIKNNDFSRLYGQGKAIPTLGAFPKTDRSGSEREFCRTLMTRSFRETLFGVVDLPNNTSMVPELVMEEFGRVDFLLRQGRSWGVLEVKMGEAPDSVVSQIDRYRMAMELDMCHGLHDEVFAIVCAESFPSYVATELSRLSVMMVEHQGDSCRFRRLT